MLIAVVLFSKSILETEYLGSTRLRADTLVLA